MVTFIALSVCVTSAFDLVVHLETVLGGGRAGATVLSVRGLHGSVREYRSTYMWEGERAGRAPTEGAARGSTVRVYVNRRGDAHRPIRAVSGRGGAAGGLGLGARTDPSALSPGSGTTAEAAPRPGRRTEPD
ncbi:MULTISPECIES: hypothetical protein [Catenuloplanes]|uniref:Uncharacterized protein n=1 Tax=Catenuloplanes niger TaxID=587534 RepID=A0AAE4CYB3_9ACTN|nr:hypothetical protein [Catenuloplanes niger]MDR7327388.1 hypothetical protein [Catenuloplanes niger]